VGVFLAGVSGLLVGEDALDSRLPAARVGDVEMNEDGAGAAAADRRRRLLSGVGLHVCHDHERALGGEPLRGRAPDSARSTGDHRHPPVKPLHLVSLRGSNIRESV
jgi:hypothetical protein